MNKDVLVKGIEIIGVLFAAFGGFLTGIAPPQASDARFAVGLSSFLSLILLFAIAALAKSKHRKAWIVASGLLFATAVAGGFLYWSNSVAYTFEYPPGNKRLDHIAGVDLTPEAKEYKQHHESISNAQLLAKFGGLENISRVWSAESIRQARTKLITSYLILVLAIASSIFALTEGALGSDTGSGKLRQTGRKLAAME